MFCLELLHILGVSTFVALCFRIVVTVMDFLSAEFFELNLSGFWTG